MKKFLSLLLFVFCLSFFGHGFTQEVSATRIQKHIRLIPGKEVQFGNSPDAKIKYSSSPGFEMVIGNTSEFSLNATTADFKNNAISTTGSISGGSVGGTSLTTTGTITSSASSSIGWSVVAGANTACNTTCTNGCVVGQDAEASPIPNAFVDCASATADVCVCAGAN